VLGSQSGLHRVLLCGCGLGAEGLVRAGKGISARDPAAAAAALMSSIWFLMVASSSLVQTYIYCIIFSSHIDTNIYTYNNDDDVYTPEVLRSCVVVYNIM